jgi:hypothetical protein
LYPVHHPKPRANDILRSLPMLTRLPIRSRLQVELPERVERHPFWIGGVVLVVEVGDMVRGLFGSGVIGRDAVHLDETFVNGCREDSERSIRSDAMKEEEKREMRKESLLRRRCRPRVFSLETDEQGGRRKLSST